MHCLEKYRVFDVVQANGEEFSHEAIMAVHRLIENIDGATLDWSLCETMRIRVQFNGNVGAYAVLDDIMEMLMTMGYR